MVEVFKAGGNMEQVMQQLLSESSSSNTANNNIQSEAIPTDAANGIANFSVSGQTNLGENKDVGGPSTAGEVEDRDTEMEDELAEELANVDAMSDYDIEITKEGEAIYEYLALLDSAGK